MATASHWSQYLALRSLSAVVHCFNAEENMRTVGAAGSIYHSLNRKHRERAQNNLKRCFPTLPQSGIERISKNSIRNMFQLFGVDSLAMPKLLRRENWADRVSIGSMQNVIELLVSEKPIVDEMMTN